MRRVGVVQLDPPRYLTVFSREGMERLCADVGLTIERVQDDSTAFQFWASEQLLAGVRPGAPLLSGSPASLGTRGVHAERARSRGSGGRVLSAASPAGPV